MPPAVHRNEFEDAIYKKDSSKILEFVQRDDAKELLLKKSVSGFLPIQDACYNNLDDEALQPILEAAVEHGIAKEMLEQKDKDNLTCLHIACDNNLSADSLLLLLECLTKHTDIKKILEAKDGYYKRNCLHMACLNRLNADSLRLLISFFPSKEMFENALAAKDYTGNTPVDACAKNKQAKQLLQDFVACRLWLFSKYQDSFLYSLHPNSLDKTCYALKELTKNGLQYSKPFPTIMLIALMSSPSKFRKAVSKTDSSAPMSSYFDVVKKKADKKSDYNHWRKHNSIFREFYGRWPPSERETTTSFVEGEGSSCACVIQ